MNFSHVNTLCNYLDLVRDFILEEGERERESICERGTSKSFYQLIVTERTLPVKFTFITLSSCLPLY